jgi:hypothetical protein
MFTLRKTGVLALRRLADESGIALVFAMLVMSSLAIMTTTVLYFANASSHASSRTSADQSAYALAEAGINTAIAKIYGATDPRTATILPAGTVGDPAVVVPKCSTGTNNAETPSCYQTGSVTYYGALDKTHGNTWYWTITSIGSVPVAGVSTVVRKLTRSVGVTGNNGTNGNSWTRFYQDSTTSCLTLDAVSVPTNFASRGDMCLINGATVTGSTTNINAGNNIYIDPPVTDNPASNAPSSGGWNTASNAYTANTTYATTAALANNTNSPNLDLSNFGFSLPTSATINGIVVNVQRKGSASTATNYITDTDVLVMKAGSITGITQHALTANKWPTADAVQAYGTATDLWGTTWTAANLNASTFGVRIRAHSTCTGTSCTVVGSVNAVTVTVYFTTGAGIGSSATPIGETDIGGGCQLSGNALHAPCSSADKVYATTMNTVPAASNPALGMPVIDWNYWWANAKPGPKHFCTNANPGLATNFFDNNASTTTKPDASLSVNGEMAPPGQPYDCEVWTNGVLEGMIKWDGAHRLDVYGTIFVDGNFRFDSDGEIVHYFGRATMMSSHDDEIDALVCAGGTGNTYATSCVANMGSWNPSQNMLVLMSQCQKGLPSCNEYDQGGTTCSGATPNCYNGHVPSGFQGILYSLGDCLIHQNFQDSGPVICNTITLPNESGINPTFYSFPSIGNLTSGMSYSDTASATDFTLNVSAQGDG